MVRSLFEWAQVLPSSIALRESLSGYPLLLTLHPQPTLLSLGHLALAHDVSQRRYNRDPCTRTGGELEPRRHHPDNHERFVPSHHGECVADDLGVGAEVAPPTVMAQHHHGRCARHVIGWP